MTGPDLPSTTLRPSKHLAAICVLAQGQAPSHPGSNGVDPTCETLEKVEKMRRKIIAELDSVGLLNMLNMLNSWNSAFWAAKTRRCNKRHQISGSTLRCRLWDCCASWCSVWAWSKREQARSAKCRWSCCFHPIHHYRMMKSSRISLRTRPQGPPSCPSKHSVGRILRLADKTFL